MEKNSQNDSTIAQAELRSEYIEKAAEILSLGLKEANDIMSDAGCFAAAQVLSDIVVDGIVEIEIQMQSSVPTKVQYQVLTPNIKMRAKLDISENYDSIRKYIDSVVLIGWVNFLKPFIDRWAALRDKK